MADMTQPERPERASIPDSEYQPPKKTAEPTHIGITIHRDARATFVPTDLKAHDMGDDVPFSPVDRTSVERLRDEAARLTVGLPDSPQSIKAPPIPMGEPLEPRKEESIPLKVKLAAAVLGVAGAAAGFLGYNKISSSSEEETGIIIPPAPTQIIPTPENPTPTVEVIPTKEPEKSPYEFGFSEKVGDVTVQISKQTQERTECPDPTSAIKSAQMVPCNPIHEIVVNRDVFPNADELVEEVFATGIYFAWQRTEKGREDVTFEQYMQRAKSGEDMSIKARGFQGSSFLPTEITINPTDEFFYDIIHEPLSIIRPWTSLGVGYREIRNEEGKNEFHLEIYSFTAMGVGDEKHPEVKNYGAGDLMAVGLSYLSFPDIQKSGTFITPAQNEANGSVVIPLREIILKRVNGIPYTVLGAK